MLLGSQSQVKGGLPWLDKAQFPTTPVQSRSGFDLMSPTIFVEGKGLLQVALHVCDLL